MKYSGVFIALLVLLLAWVSESKSHVTKDDSSRSLQTDDDYAVSANDGGSDDGSNGDDDEGTDDDAGTDDAGMNDDATDDNDDNGNGDDGADTDDDGTNVTDDGTVEGAFRMENLGSTIYLDNIKEDGSVLEDDETPAGTISRLQGLMPTDNPMNIRAEYNPLTDAFCFNQHYPVPSLSSPEQHRLYRDYTTAFDLIKEPTTELSEDFVTFDRITSMFLRMCFHDNAIDATQQDFRQYVSSAIHPVTKQWTAESRYMKTSGADASNLICPEERFHPNNNYDQTASRVLRSIQTKLKHKYPDMSYADLLHNGCNAVIIYLTERNPVTSLDSNPFTFGGKDACYVNKDNGQKHPLCGPSEILPRNTIGAVEATRWFTSRGMSACLFISLMWTHTIIAPMASMCPLTRLTCTTSSEDVATFPDPTALYFKAEDNLDFFNFFLARGTHESVPNPEDENEPGCKWIVDGQEVPWPLTGIDCNLSLSSVQQTGPKSLAKAIKNFAHNRHYNRIDTIQCALNILNGAGGGTEGGSCNDVIPSECQPSSDHSFGGFYGTNH